MTRRKYPREADVCRCSHLYVEHQWAFPGEPEPCGVLGCRCVDFKADGLPADPDRDDQEAAR